MSYVPIAVYQKEDLGALFSHGSPVLVVSCSGFYLLTETYDMIHPGYGVQEYDSIALPGASAGIKYPDWRTSFFQQLQLLVSIHDTILIYIIDHMDCGVYKQLYGSDGGVESFVHHSQNMGQLRNEILALYPTMDVKMFLAGNDGVLYQLK